VIALSCGIKISALHCLVLSQSTRVTDRWNYDSQDLPSIDARAVKTTAMLINLVTGPAC